MHHQSPTLSPTGNLTAGQGSNATYNIYGTPGPVSSTRYFAGGGSGSPGPGGAVPAPPGGGGGAKGSAGTTNTGGAGGANSPGSGAAGGSGIVMIRYKFQ